ncbi:MAG: hypothetical protein AAB632_02215 [Patescibacteria group bacterium]
MSLNIKYNKDLEAERIKNTLSKMSWFNEHGYEFLLPKKFNYKNDSDTYIRQCIEEEYHIEDYAKVAKQINKDYLPVDVQYTQALKELFGENICTDFEVILTKYGTGGSYWLPNKIIINIINKHKPQSKVVLHEICHLMIEKNILKYKLLQLEKERTVDLILNSKSFEFLNYSWWNDYYGKTEKYIDEHFEKEFFKSPENFFKKVSSVRNK